MEWILRSGLKFGVFPALKVVAPGLEVVVTTRAGGKSPAPFDSLNLGGALGDRPGVIRANRKLLRDAIGIPPGGLARTGQIHGSEIAVVSRGGSYPGFDGFVTSTSGLSLAISTADCYPVVVYSPPERALAALHVGRKGAERGIVRRAIDILMERDRIDPAYAIACVGPGICRSCYTVSREDARRFPASARSYERGAWHLDLEAFIAGELAACGLPARSVFRSRLCTACNPGLFYSHRRDAGITGRHWTLATIRSADEHVL